MITHAYGSSYDFHLSIHTNYIAIGLLSQKLWRVMYTHLYFTTDILLMFLLQSYVSLIVLHSYYSLMSIL